MARPASNLDKLSSKVINFLNAQHPGRFYNRQKIPSNEQKVVEPEPTSILGE